MGGSRGRGGEGGSWRGLILGLILGMGEVMGLLQGLTSRARVDFHCVGARIPAMAAKGQHIAGESERGEASGDRVYIREEGADCEVGFDS